MNKLDEDDYPVDETLRNPEIAEKEETKQLLNEKEKF